MVLFPHSFVKKVARAFLPVIPPAGRNDNIICPASGDLIFSKGFYCPKGMIFTGKDHESAICVLDARWKLKREGSVILVAKICGIKCLVKLKNKPRRGLLRFSLGLWDGTLKFSCIPYTGLISTTKLNPQLISIFFGGDKIDLIRIDSNRDSQGHYEVAYVNQTIMQLALVGFPIASTSFFSELNLDGSDMFGLGKRCIGRWMFQYPIQQKVHSLPFLLLCFSMLALYSTVLWKIDTDVSVSS